jgi:hypothetical protein
MASEGEGIHERAEILLEVRILRGEMKSNLNYSSAQCLLTRDNPQTTEGSHLEILFESFHEVTRDRIH